MAPLDSKLSPIGFFHLESMIRIRQCELAIASARKSLHIGGPVHLGVGQEAIAVGVSNNLHLSDKVFGAHRSHSHLLALGSSIEKLFAETLGRIEGHSKGMGGSMHLWDESVGFYGSVPIVAGTVPIAVGAALACKMKKDSSISVSYLGDGAVEEGVVFESLNLASVLKLPILFVVENNYFASHMHISERQPSEITSRLAEANNIPYKIVDGNDVFEVNKAAAELIANIRASGTPGFLEAFTYRWFGHVDWREDLDVGVGRSAEELFLWKQRDPIKRLSNALLKEGILTVEKLNDLNQSMQKEVASAFELAMKIPYPESSYLLDMVYAK